MIYPDEFESKVGFSSVRAALVEKCVSPMGRREVENMSFSSSFSVVERSLKSTWEMVTALQSAIDVPLDNLHDLSQGLKSIRTEGNYLTGEQLHKLRGFLESMEKISAFVYGKDEDGNPLYPWMSQVLEGIACLPHLATEIGRVVNKFGDVKDTASLRLQEIRRDMASATAGISSAMKRVISRAVSAGILDKDVTPAMRDGRLVIPVEASKKRSIQGIIHDESATGKTSFIEPFEVVEAANRLRELEMEEHREIIVVLIALAAVIRPHVDDILKSSHIAGRFDFIHAKALYAFEIGAQLPNLSKKPMIDWYHAVHPVLLLTLRAQGKNVVPLNLQLNKNQRILIISGPNAGGKSVALKTIGIVQYMAQCGVIPPLYDNSHVGLFENIFIDIGDEQSLENDLSTYSSHLRNMRVFLRRANSSSLVLADEMGSGTEPQIGGALAQAILVKLNADNKCFGVITTHYQNLKTLADNEEGFINGAMLYDRQRLQPLFELSIGNAGSSFALEIARKSALPDDVIEAAKQIVGSEYVDMDKYMLDIARDRRYWANKRLAIKEKEKKIEQLLESLEERSEQLKAQRADILKSAREEAKEILSGVNAKIENTIHEIRKSAAEKEHTKSVRKELEDYKRQLSEAEGDDKNLPHLLKTKNKKNQKGGKPAEKPSVPSESRLSPGDYVRMSNGGVIGKVLNIKDKQAEVAFGGLRTFVDLKKLIPATKPKQDTSSQKTILTSSTIEDSRKRQLNFKQELDVRGFRADEALQAVAYFLDDAVQFNIGRVRILHGTGSGALRVAIRNYLSAFPSVESFHDEDVRLGGAGITVVNLT